jgi:hypothetical protein
MADPILTPHTGITAAYGGPVDDSDGKFTGYYSYTITDAQSGAQEKIESAYDRDKFNSLMGVDFNSPAGHELASTLASSFEKLQYKDQRGYIDRGVKPVIRSIPAFFVGGPWDILGLLSYVPNPVELIAMGYEAVTGDDPLGMNERRREQDKAFRKGVEETYGTEATRRRYQQNLRAFDNYAMDHWGFKPFEATVGTDMTTEARGIWEKMTTTGLEMAVSGPVMISGVTVPAKALQETAKFTFARLAKESAKELGEDALNPQNMRSLIDKANDYVNPLTKTGRRNIRAEGAFGGGAGVATEASLAALNEVDPDAAGWVKMSVAIGSGLVAPLAARSIYTGFLQGPVVSLASKITDPLFRPGKTAARYTQREGMGKSLEDRAGIASVARLFEEAVKDGRHVDQASGLAFTTPELARSESNILRAELQLKRERLGQETDPDVQARLEKEIQADEANVGYLNRYANFQESVLVSAANDKSPGIVAKFFKNEADRLVQRREQFFNYIENNFKKSMDDLDFGGKPGGTPQEIRLDYASAKNGEVPVFEDTRRKLVMEGDPKGVEASELAWLDPQLRDKVGSRREDLTRNMDEAFAESQRAAEDRVKFWEESVQSYLADRGLSTLPDAEKALVGDIIRGTYDDAYREFRAFEKAAYGRIKGLDDKVTENIVFPEGSVDHVDASNISGMTVDEWAAGRLDNLSRSERFNIRDVPVELAQLAGSRSVIAQLNRRRAAAVAEGRADAAQSRIPDLEKQRDEVIAQKTKAEAELDTQVETERLDSERLARSLDEYVQSTLAKLDDAQKQVVLEFSTSPTVPWETMTLKEARARAPVGLEDVFAQVAKQKKAMATLGEGVASSKTVKRKREEALALGKEAQGFQSDIDKITRDFLGAGDDVVIEPTGRLTSLDADGALVAGGTSADDVRETISDVAEAARREVATNGKTPRYRSQLLVRKTLEQLLSPETFPTLDPVSLAFGREASRLKHRVDDAQGDILGKDKGAAVKVPVEEVATKVLPEAASPLTRAYNLRVLNEAVAELPDFVTIKRGDDGKIVTDAEGIPVAAIDEDALIGGQSLFDHPDSPFELVRVGEARTQFEIRLKPNAPVSPRSLQVAESILLERMALRFPDGVDSKSLEAFRNKNRETLQFLEDNGRGDVPKMLNDADGLAAQLDALNTLRKDKTRRQLTELVNSGGLDLQGLKIDDYLDYIGQRRRRFSEENAFSEVLKADAGYATADLFDRILDPKNTAPKTSLNEFLSVVRGSRPAEKGLHASIIGELFRRSTTRDNAIARDALIRQTGDVYASAFDPAKFRELMSNSRVRSLLQEAFPDNPQLLDGLDDIAKVAFETSTFTRGSARMAAAIDPQAAVSTEVWSNLGRILGLQVADRIGFINSLVAAGAGGRVFRNVGKNITGNKIKDILIEAAIDPKRAIELARKTSELGDEFATTLAKGIIDIVNVPGAVVKYPAATIPILKRGVEELDESEDIGDQSSVQPAGPPARRMAANASQSNRPSLASTLSQVNPVGPPQGAPPPRPTGPSSQEMVQRGRDVFGPNDPIFAAHGGYLAKESGIMSVPCKPRQLVG